MIARVRAAVGRWRGRRARVERTDERSVRRWRIQTTIGLLMLPLSALPIYLYLTKTEAAELIYLKGTAKDHMERIMLDRFDRVMCWKERCGKGYPCQYCRSYRQPHPPPFGVEGAETVGEADAEPASSEVAPSL